MSTVDEFWENIDETVVLAEEADYAENVRCVVMPCCGFAFDAGHLDDRPGPPQYTCPNCVPVQNVD